jgi:hypothetical protein
MADEENNKVTLAVLSQQILTMTQEMTAMRSEMRVLTNGIADYRVLQSRHDTQISNLGDDFNSLSNRVNGWSVLNSFGVVLAAILGMIFGTRSP